MFGIQFFHAMKKNQFFGPSNPSHFLRNYTYVLKGYPTVLKIASRSYFHKISIIFSNKFYAECENYAISLSHWNFNTNY